MAAIEKKRIFFLLDFLVIVIAGTLLYYGSSWQFTRSGVDTAIYQCYATSFWLGHPGIQHLPAGQCTFLTSKNIIDTIIAEMVKYHMPLIAFAQYQNAAMHFHTLPHEYPILSLIPFSLPLIAPAQWYQQTYAIWAIILIAVLYFIIARYTSRKHALLFLLYMVIAGWSTATSRFDLFPASLTLGALILGYKQRWRWAYVCIAAGVLLKFYPVLLLPPLLIAEQKSYTEKWLSWTRWKAFTLVFVGVCVLCEIISLLISVPGTIGAFAYFTSRPLEIESLPGSLVWLGHYIGFPYQYVYAFVSMNVTSHLSGVLSLLSTIALGGGLLYTLWLQWRQKLDIKNAFLIIMALILCTGKILSPQYLLWIIPLVAYVGKPNWRWILPWLTIMVLTYAIYPVVYNESSPPPEIIFPLSLARGLILLGFVVIMLWKHSRQQAQDQVASQQETGKTFMHTHNNILPAGVGND